MAGLGRAAGGAVTGWQAYTVNKQSTIQIILWH